MGIKDTMVKIWKKSNKNNQNKKGLNDTYYSTNNNNSLNYGGLYNSYSGIGTHNDKSRQSIFLPTIINSSEELDIILNESWAAKTFINLPVEQMFIRERQIEGLSPEELKSYNSYFDHYHLENKLSRAMKAGRLYGSAFLIFITKEAPLDTPLNINELKSGDLLNIVIFHRYLVSVIERCYDLRSLDYGKPTLYRIQPRFGGTFHVHSSRMLRFDGQNPLTDDYYTIYDQDFGISELIPVIQAIYQEAQAANGISQLIEEASIGIMKMPNFREALGVPNSPDSPSLEAMVAHTNQYKSIYRMLCMSSEDEFDRTEVNLAGVGNILDSFSARLASACRIPQTIFLGQSPQGLNATGESDMEINAANVSAMQKNILREAYNRVDEIMIRTSGLDKKFIYTFPSLIESSDKDKADVALIKSQAVVQLQQEEIITRDEARQVLDGDPVLGNYEDQDFSFSKELQKAKDLNNYAQTVNSKSETPINDGVTPYKDFPIMADETEWDEAKARSQIRKKSESDEDPSSDYKEGFMWFDGNNDDNYGGYKLPYVYVVNGKYEVVPRALSAIAALINSRKSRLKISESDKEKIKAKINRYYKRMNKESPFNDDD